jgi:hypothetical protein
MTVIRSVGMTPNLRMIPHRIGVGLETHRTANSVDSLRTRIRHLHAGPAVSKKSRLQKGPLPKENARPSQVGRFSIFVILPQETACCFLERPISSSDRPAE